MPSNARKKAITSSMTSRPTTRATVRRNACAAALVTRNVVRVGAISIRKIRLSRQPGEPARRVEEVERVPGGWRVDDDEVEPARRRAARRASPSPCTPACPRARRRCCGRSGSSRMRCACSSSSAYCVTSWSNVDFGVEHQRVESTVHRRVAVGDPTATGRSRAACSRGARARACSARRLAGSMVTTTASRPSSRALDRERRRGGRLAHAAGAAAHHDVARCRRASAKRHRVDRDPSPRHPRRTRRRGRSTSAGPTSAVKRNGSSICGQREQRRRAARTAPADASRASIAERAAAASAAASESSSVDAGRAFASARTAVVPHARVGAQAVDVRQATVHDDRAERDAGAVLDRERGVDQLVDRRLLGQGHEHHLAARRGR